ncbi:MAG TPA: DUF4148 domain-containing protein [Burkholderiaceae bacterium]|nr:DUF4148 domain-containing protein [Burkholderiaceae bacterium]
MLRIKAFVAAVLLALSGAAFAQEATEFMLDINKMSATTRAEILKMLAEARAAGKVPHGEAGLVLMVSPGMADRVRVRAEAAEARRLGLLPMGDVNPKQATPEQARQIKAAGDKAVAEVKAMMIK